MALYDEGVTSDSPAEIDVETPVDGAPSAGTQNTGTIAPPAERTIPYPRFKEVNDGYRSEAAARAAAETRAAMYQQQMEQTRAEVAELRGQLQRTATQEPTTPEEAKEQRAALAALKKLNALDPEYQKFQGAAKIMPLMAKTLLEMQAKQQALETRSSQAFVNAEIGRLGQLARDSGMTFASKPEADAFESYVAGIIRSDPRAHEAFRNGDPSILPEAVKIAKQQYETAARAARVGLANTKAQTSRLPPRIGGAQPGSPPPPRFDPKDPRGSMDKIHAAAEAFLSSQG